MPFDPTLTDAALLDQMGTDAAMWASEFVNRFNVIAAEDLMVGWFANAIEAGRSAALAAANPPAPSLGIEYPPFHDPAAASPPAQADETDPGDVPFPARRAMQQALWDECIRPGDNEWTTWTDSIALAETAAKALRRAGWEVVPMTSDSVASDV